MKYRLRPRTVVLATLLLAAFLLPLVLPQCFPLSSVAGLADQVSPQESTWMVAGGMLFVLLFMILFGADYSSAFSSQGELDRLVGWKQRMTGSPWPLRIPRKGRSRGSPAPAVPLDPDVGFEHLLEQKRSGAWDWQCRKSVKHRVRTSAPRGLRANSISFGSSPRFFPVHWFHLPRSIPPTSDSSCPSLPEALPGNGGSAVCYC